MVEFASPGRRGNGRARAGTHAAAAIVLASVLGGCAADSAMFRADWNWWSNSRPAPARAASPESLIGPDGACLAAGGEMPKGVTLGMTECDLVRLAGPTDQISISNTPNGERLSVITYPQGERAGIYRFSAGLLVSIERAPELPKPARPQRGQRRQPPPPPRGY